MYWPRPRKLRSVIEPSTVAPGVSPPVAVAAPMENSPVDFSTTSTIRMT
jgi:hypothetical protein